MNRQEIKGKYEQFKRWQREPVKYTNCDDVHYCNNCGLMFTGNFCPRCSQKADLGRINWNSVRNGIMDIWGLGTRSLLFSIWQLLLRPGYFISDYISGKRQVSFPPVKMLFIVTVIYSLVIYWLFPQVFGIHLYDTDEESRQLLGDYYQWYESHFSWAMLGMSVLAIIPTWIMFRYAPRNTREFPFDLSGADRLCLLQHRYLPVHDVLLYRWLYAALRLWIMGHLLARGVHLTHYHLYPIRTDFRILRCRFRCDVRQAVLCRRYAASENPHGLWLAVYGRHDNACRACDQSYCHTQSKKKSLVVS